MQQTKKQPACRTCKHQLTWTTPLALMTNISEGGGAPRAEVTEHTYKHTSKVLEAAINHQRKLLINKYQR